MISPKVEIKVLMKREFFILPGKIIKLNNIAILCRVCNLQIGDSSVVDW